MTALIISAAAGAWFLAAVAAGIVIGKCIKLADSLQHLGNAPAAPVRGQS